ncbi:MAG: BrnA antitoxin family protein [Candidatus Brocadiaceae bacterium]|nr:BrnA antitoxin family protein [Candidatus Brocadiaceae bacterium]
MEKSKLKSMTITEASEYFDKHDIFEFEDVKEVTDVKFKLQRKKYVGLDMGLFKKIQNKARKLHKDEDALIQEWLVEKVG